MVMENENIQMEELYNHKYSLYVTDTDWNYTVE